MKKEFLDYLKQIGITDLFQKRVLEILGFYEKYCSMDVADIFVSEYIVGDDKRQYENLWLFTPFLACEAKQFLTQDNFDALSIAKKITRWEIQKTEYDFQKATDKSRMTLFFNIAENLHGNLQASKENCDVLRDIFQKYIVPNLVE